MYRFLKKINNVYSKYDVLNDNLIANIGNGIEAHITFFDSDFKIIKSIDKTSYTFLLRDNRMIFTTQKTLIDGEKALESYYYNVKEEILEKMDYTLNLGGLIYHNKLLCSSSLGNLTANSQKFWIEVDLDSLEIINRWTNQLGFLNSYGNYTGCQLYFGESFISSTKSDGKIGLFDFKNKTIWQHNFSEECRHIDYDKIDRDENELVPGQVQFITPYGDDKIIVSCKWSNTFCIELATGKILWENMHTGNREYIIAGDIGFVYTNGGGIHKIDLKTGESLHPDKRFHRLSEMPYYNDIHISTNTDGIVYYDGLLWARIYSNGYSFIVAINPYDYHYEWIHRVETKEKLMGIKFYDNRMYLNTSGSELYIYEKE